MRVIVLYVLLHTAGLLPLLCPQCRCAPSSSTEPCSRRISLTFNTHVPGGGQRRAGGLHPEPALLHPRERGEGGAAGPPRGAGTRGRTVRVRLPPPRRVRRRRGAGAGQAGGARGCGQPRVGRQSEAPGSAGGDLESRRMSDGVPLCLLQQQPRAVARGGATARGTGVAPTCSSRAREATAGAVAPRWWRGTRDGGGRAPLLRAQLEPTAPLGWGPSAGGSAGAGSWCAGSPLSPSSTTRCCCTSPGRRRGGRS